VLPGTEEQPAFASLLSSMFSRDSILFLRATPSGTPPLSLFRFGRRCYCAETLMEAKAHLLGCLRKVSANLFSAPRLIVVDSGPYSRDFKAELELWLSKHPRLAHVEIVVAQRSCRIARTLMKWIAAAGYRGEWLK
jgi:hypothetical protein